MEKVKIGKYDFKKEEWKYVSDDAKRLINHMLEYNPATRFSAE